MPKTLVSGSKFAHYTTVISWIMTKYFAMVFQWNALWQLKRSKIETRLIGFWPPTYIWYTTHLCSSWSWFSKSVFSASSFSTKVFSCKDTSSLSLSAAFPTSSFSCIKPASYTSTQHQQQLSPHFFYGKCSHISYDIMSNSVTLWPSGPKLD